MFLALCELSSLLLLRHLQFAYFTSDLISRQLFKMHYKALTSFLVAIPCVSAVVHSCYGGKPGEVGMKCLEEGSEWCDVSCTNAVSLVP